MAPKPIDVTIRGKNETKPAFDAASKDAQGFGATVTGLANGAMSLLKTAIAGVVGAGLASFFRDAIKSAADADVSWTKVASALGNLGINANGVSGELNTLFSKIQATTRFSDDEAASAFAQLVSISGDYQGSLKNLNLVTDVAAAKGLGLEEAATLVGKAMTGNTSTLKRYGIVVKEGTDAVAAMQEKFRGFAENDGRSLQGRLNQIANAWDNVKESVGRALTGSDGISAGGNQLADALNRLGNWIDANSGGFHEFLDDFATLVGYLRALPDLTSRVYHSPLFQFLVAKPVSGILGGWDRLFEKLATATGAGVEIPDHIEADALAERALAKRARRVQAETDKEIAANAKEAAAEKARREAEAAEKAEAKRLEQLRKEIELLAKAAELRALTPKQIERMNELEAQFQHLLAGSGGTLEQRDIAAEGLKKLRGANPIDRQSALAIPDAAHTPGLQITTVDVNGQATASNKIGFRQGAPAGLALPSTEGIGSIGEEFTRSFKGATAAVRETSDTVQDLGHVLGEVAGGALENLTGEWMDAMAAVSEGTESAGEASLKAVRHLIGGSVIAKGRETMLDASKQLALAIAEPFAASQHLVAAAKLFAIGSAYGLLGGQLSGGGGYGGGGGGGGLSGGGFSSAQQQVGGTGKLTVILQGKKTVIDHRNADDLAALKQAFQTLAGNREIVIQVQD